MNIKKFILSIFLAALMFVADGAAQTKAKKNLKNRLPRVGLIKDYPATGLMTGCGNLYFVPPQNKETTGEEYIFLARGEGDDAWMNLNGRDTSLCFLKTRITRKDGAEAIWRYYYAAGATRISVFISNNRQYVNGDDYPFKMIITLRRGRAVRRVKAVGYSDC